MRTGELISKKHRRSYARNFLGRRRRATISPREDCCRLWQQRRRLSCGGSNLTHPAPLSEPKALLVQLKCAVLLFAAFAVLWIPLLPLAACLDLSLCLCTACKLAPPQSRHSFVLVQDWSATIQN